MRLQSKLAELQIIDEIDEIIDRDAKARMSANRFIESLTSQGFPSAEKMLSEKFTGRAIFDSKQMKDFRAVGRHYEWLGTAIRLGYLDFDVVFEVITFPDEFWTKSKPYREIIRKNYKAKGDPLPDFWANFEALEKQYQLSLIHI